MKTKKDFERSVSFCKYGFRPQLGKTTTQKHIGKGLVMYIAYKHIYQSLCDIN